MNPKRNHHKKQQQGSSVFELMLVVGVASFFGSTIVPLLGTTADFDNRLQEMMHEDMETHLISAYAAGMGVNEAALIDTY